MRYGSNERSYLFTEYHTHGVISAQDKQLAEEIASFDEDRILKTNPDELAKYFFEKYLIETPVLLEDKIQAEQSEEQIDVSQDQVRSITDRSQPVYVTGTRISFIVPYLGDQPLFKCSPNIIQSMPIEAQVEQDHIMLNYVFEPGREPQDLRQQFDLKLSEIKKYLNMLRGLFEPFNSGLEEKAKTMIENRREKLLKDQGIASSLGFPIKRRGDAPKTYTVSVPKKIKMTIPEMTDDPFTPEPELELKEYENILGIVKNMVIVMERSPKAFKDMNEESIREHFLVQLNGQYAGIATGETFNYSGKTDILIRVKDKNIFIAECKFWEGEDHFLKAVDQILGYSSWRDSKTAILLFNRNKNFTDVIEKSISALKRHESYTKHDSSYQSESGHRCILKSNDDDKKELILTLECFNIPDGKMVEVE